MLWDKNDGHEYEFDGFSDKISVHFYLFKHGDTILLV